MFRDSSKSSLSICAFALSLLGKFIQFYLHFSFVLIALCFVIGDACSLRNYQKFSFGFVYRLLHTFCHKFNLFIVNNFDSVLQLSIGKLCSF